MGYIGGMLQQVFVGRVRGAERERLLAVAIDVGKHTAAALVCDFWGELVVPPFTFALNERCLATFTTAVRAEAAREALWVRTGLEETGHHHETLLPGSSTSALTWCC